MYKRTSVKCFWTDVWNGLRVIALLTLSCTVLSKALRNWFKIRQAKLHFYNGKLYSIVFDGMERPNTLNKKTLLKKFLQALSIIQKGFIRVNTVCLLDKMFSKHLMFTMILNASIAWMKVSGIVDIIPKKL